MKVDWAKFLDMLEERFGRGSLIVQSIWAIWILAIGALGLVVVTWCFLFFRERLVVPALVPGWWGVAFLGSIIALALASYLVLMWKAGKIQISQKSKEDE